MKQKIIYAVTHILNYLPSSIIPGFFTFATIYIFTRVFSRYEYGVYSYLLLILVQTRLLISQWLLQSTGRFIPGVKKNELTLLKQIIATYLSALFIIVILLSQVYYWFFIKYFNSSYVEYILPGFILIIASTVFDVLNTVLQAEMRSKEFTVNKTLNSFFVFISKIFLIMVFFEKNPVNLVWGSAIGNLLMIPLLIKQTNIRLPNIDIVKRKLFIEKTKQFLFYGIPMIGWYFSAYLLEQGDRYVIKNFLGEGELGIYAANYSLVNGGILFLISPIHLFFHPYILKISKETELENIGKIVLLICEIIMKMGIIASSVLYLFSENISKILGQEFQEGHVIMPIILFALVFWHIGLFLQKPLEIVKKTKVLSVISLLVATLNIILNFIFVPEYGYISAAYTTLVSYFFYFILIYINSKKNTTIKVEWLRWSIIIIISLIIIFLLKFIKNYLIVRFNSTIGLLYFILITIVILLFLIKNIYHSAIKKSKKIKI